jgi:hypothetical protein
MPVNHSTQRNSRAAKNALATLAVEGLTPSKEAIRLGKLRVQGKLTCNQAVAKIISDYNKSAKLK